MRAAALLGALLLAGACSSPAPVDVRALGLEELYARLAPAAGEKAVLVNLWASW